MQKIPLDVSACADVGLGDGEVCSRRCERRARRGVSQRMAGDASSRTAKQDLVFRKTRRPTGSTHIDRRQASSCSGRDECEDRRRTKARVHHSIMIFLII